MSEPRKQFTFYRSYYDAIQELPKRDQSALILAICDYALYEREPTGLPPAASIAFKLIRPTLDSGRKKAASGARGGTQANGKQSASKTQANGKQSAREKEREIEIEIEKEIEIESKSEATSCFDAFWESYPRKVGKGAAKAAFERMNPDSELFAKLMSALESHKLSAQWTKDNGQYIPNPVTWLDQMRWEDELPAPAKDQANSSFETDEFFEAALAKSLRDHGKLTEGGDSDDQNGE